MLKEGNETGIVGRPKNLDERVILASQCVTQYKFTLPTVIDGMDGKVNKDYKAAPVRVTIVDVDGKVAFYAGRGPRDFRIPPVERTLKKLIANKGYMPPPPEPQWGPVSEGLRCGLALDPEKLAIGQGVAVQLKFENTTDEPIDFYYRPALAAGGMVIRNDDGETLKIEVFDEERESRRRGKSDSPVRRIEPGQTFKTEVEGKVVAADDEVLAAGQFRALCNFEVDDEMVAQIDPAPTDPVWTGKITSGACTLNMTLPEQLGCIDCHGGADYHHVHEQDCDKCHVGEVGNADFGTRDESCIQCHPREGLRGRRQVLGAGGEFDAASTHVSGTIEDRDCLRCHDHSRHGDGVVSLIDPDSGRADPWTGTRTEFCLACHDGEPPEDVSFPTEPAGSGFNKLSFMGSALAQSEQGCSYCHMPHGSPYPALLKDLHSH